MLKLKKVEDALLFLTLLLLPTQLGKHFWPDFSYIYSLKIDYFSPTLYFWDILVAALLVVWILTKPKINRLALNLFLVFLLSQFISLVGAVNIGAGIVRLEQYMVAGLFGVWVASANFQTLLKFFYLPLIVGILAESLLAILQFIKGSTLGLWILGERAFNLSTPGIAKFDFQGTEVLRPYATFSHPNVLAGFTLSVLCIIYYVLREKHKLNKFVLLFGSLAIFLTMSRTAILAGFGLLPVLLSKKWLILMAVILVIVSPILFTRFTSVFNFDNLTFLRREELIGIAWQMFVQSPIIGIGLNNFIEVASSNLVTGPNRFLQPVHNIFLLVLSETGIIGLIGLLFLIGFPILNLFKLNPKPYTSSSSSSLSDLGVEDLSLRAEGLYPILPWIIIIFLGMFDHYFLTLPQGYRLLFLVWGISLSFLALHSNPRS